MKMFLLVALLSMTVTGAMAQKVALTRNGKPAAVIVISKGAAAPVQFGAKELQLHLKLISGAELPIISEGDKLPKSIRNQIKLVSDAALSEEEYSVRTTPGTITISGGGKRGTLYGCYALLEEELGVRWYTAKVTHYPRRRSIMLNSLSLHGKPAFEYREPYFTEALDRSWAVRNRTNGSLQNLDESVGGRVAYGKFVHTFNDLVPPKEWFGSHPEYFSLVDGQRRNGYYQLCLTNPDVLKLAIAQVKNWIKENPDATIFSVSQNDTYGYCQCDNCKAIEKEEGAPSGVVLRFVNSVAEAIEKDHPNVLIDTLAYQWTEDPPKHVHPRPNVRVRLAPINACFGHPIDKCDANKKVMSNLTAWSQITNQLYVWHYCTDFANYLMPMPDLDELAGDIPLFKKNGVVGIFYEGAYPPNGGADWAELKSYLIAKLLWNPDRPAKPIITEYLQGVYGKAAPEMQQWLDLVHHEVRANNIHVTIYDAPDAKYLPAETLKQGVDLFDRAEKAVEKDPIALDYVQRARLWLDYTRMMRAPKDSPERKPLEAKVGARIKQYQIGEIREGQPVAEFLKSIGQ